MVFLVNGMNGSTTLYGKNCKSYSAPSPQPGPPPVMPTPTPCATVCRK